MNGFHFFFELYLLDLGQPHFLGDVLGGQSATIPYKTVVVGHSLKIYPVRIKVDTDMPLSRSAQRQRPGVPSTSCP